MTCYHIVTVKLFCSHIQLVELEIPVAVYARVRSYAVLVCVYKAVNHIGFKSVGEIENVIRHIKRVSNAPCVLYIVKRTTAMLS